MKTSSLMRCGLVVAGFALGCVVMRLIQRDGSREGDDINPRKTLPSAVSDKSSDRVAVQPANPAQGELEFVHPTTRKLLAEFASLAEEGNAGGNASLAARLDELLKCSDESRRTLHFSLLLELMRPADAPLVAQMFEDLTRQGLGFNPEANFFAQRWGELDPDAALAWVVDGSKYERGGVLLDRILSGWALKKPDEAAQWVMEQAEGKLKDAAIQGTATGWARHDPAGATAFVMTLPASKARDHAGKMVFWQVLYQQGIAAAAAWYDELPASAAGIRKQVFPAIAERQSNRKDAAADAWVEQRGAALSQ